MTATHDPAEHAAAMRARLRAVPEPILARPAALDDAVALSLSYLESPAAHASIATDSYWPKWDSPWWHMLVIYELGHADRIPLAIRRAMIAAVGALPIQIFPISEHDSPPGTDPYRDSSCHCAIGSLYQVLAAAGHDVEQELPLTRRWFVRYQMADGGLNCDATAYLVRDECASSMVATVPSLEAMLTDDPSRWSPERIGCIDRAAECLLARQLSRGSASVHNAEERAREPLWRQLCFPRLYFYDVLRGLAVVARWAELRGRKLPAAPLTDVIDHLIATSPDGVVRIGRRSFSGTPTMARAPDGSWQRGRPATMFRLLDQVSQIGEPSVALTEQWTVTRRRLIAVLD